MQDISVKRTEAYARQRASAKLSPQERLAGLDSTFGVGQGAKRERAKLAAKLQAQKAPKPKAAKK